MLKGKLLDRLSLMPATGLSGLCGVRGNAKATECALPNSLFGFGERGYELFLLVVCVTDIYVVFKGLVVNIRRGLAAASEQKWTPSLRSSRR